MNPTDLPTESEMSRDMKGAWGTMRVVLTSLFGRKRAVTDAQTHAMWVAIEAMQAIGDGDWDELARVAAKLQKFRSWPSNAPPPAPGPRFRLVDEAQTASRTGKAAAALRRLADMVASTPSVLGPVVVSACVRVPVASTDDDGLPSSLQDDYLVSPDYDAETPTLMIEADGRFYGKR